MRKRSFNTRDRSLLVASSLFLVIILGNLDYVNPVPIANALEGMLFSNT